MQYNVPSARIKAEERAAGVQRWESVVLLREKYLREGDL